MARITIKDDVALEAGPAQTDRKRLLIMYRGDEELFRDMVNTNSAESRQKFVGREETQCCTITPDELLAAIIPLANQADEEERARLAAAEAARCAAAATRPATPLISAPGVLDLRIPDGRTELANAGRFIVLHKDDVAWCQEWKTWLVNDGKRWERGADHIAEEKAKDVAEEVWRQTGQIAPNLNHSEAKELTRFAMATSSGHSIREMLRCSRGHQEMIVRPAEIDSSPYLLNCVNGTVDLRTGALLPHNRDDMLTKICPTPYDPDAICPRFEAALQKIFAQTPASMPLVESSEQQQRRDQMIAYVKRLFGMGLIGEIVEEILLIFWGEGANGKSFLVSIIMEVLGSDYAIPGHRELLLKSKSNLHSCEIAKLHGQRLVVFSETDAGRHLSESTVKSLTSREPMDARGMGENPWSFKPSHTAILQTNHKPQITGTDHGIWRRPRLVPFLQTFWSASKGETGLPEWQADPMLANQLRDEHPGILAELVRGCLAFQQNGLDEPEEVRLATTAYRQENNSIALFIDEHCEFGPLEYTVRGTTLMDRAEPWCRMMGLPSSTITPQRLGEYLARVVGVQAYRSNGMVYRGLRLRDLMRFEQLACNGRPPVNAMLTLAR